MDSRFMVLFFLLALSCTKTETKEHFYFRGEALKLVGTWEWQYSTFIDDYCLGETLQKEYTPTSEMFNCKVTFEKTGELIVERTDGVNDLVLASSYSYLNSETLTVLDIDFEDRHFYGFHAYLNADSLNLSQYPFFGDTGCDKISNYFIRIK